MPLTDVAIRKAAPSEKPYKLTDGEGLYLLVNGAGKYWRFDYRFADKRKTLALGTYPDVALADARSRLKDARRLLANDTDPAEFKQEAKRAAKIAQTNSFEAMAREWHGMKSKQWAKPTADKTLAHLQAYVFPEIGHLPITAVKPAQLLAMLRKVETKGIGYTAIRLREVCSQIFRFAVATGRAEDNPAAHLLGALHRPAAQHRPAITDRRVFGVFLRDLREREGRVSPITLAACRFAMLTFVRAQEFRFAEWAEIDWQAKEWKVPAKRMKVGKHLPAHVVPLSSQALALLKTLQPLTGHTPYLFPKVAGNGEAAVISENTVGKLLNDMGYQGRQCVHGFRASARSILSEQGWSRDAMERQLDHKEKDSVVAAYARAEHLPERRKMMQAWADTCDALETGAAVLQFPAKA